MRIVLAIIIILFGLKSTAQQRYNHGVFWFRLALADTINSKIKWEVLLQKRTQNVGSGDPNIFATPQFNSIWIWWHYSIARGLKISVSPFGYFESYILNTKPEDAQQQSIKEFRWAARVEHELKGWLVYSNRYNLEYRRRDLQNDNRFVPNWRIRYMARFEKGFTGILSDKKPVTFIVYDEIFLQFGKAVR